MKSKITKNLEVRNYRTLNGISYAQITDIHGVVVGYIDPTYNNQLGFTGQDIIDGLIPYPPRANMVEFILNNSQEYSALILAGQDEVGIRKIFDKVKGGK